MNSGKNRMGESRFSNIQMPTESDFEDVMGTGVMNMEETKQKKTISYMVAYWTVAVILTTASCAVVGLWFGIVVRVFRWVTGI